MNQNLANFCAKQIFVDKNTKMFRGISYSKHQNVQSAKQEKSKNSFILTYLSDVFLRKK